MNRLNWVQQNEDYNVKYHVLKWKTSHFHEPYVKHSGGGAHLKQGAAPAAAAKEIQTDAEGLGLGLADRKKSGRPGFGLGQDGPAARVLTGEETGRDGVRISSQGISQQGREALHPVVQTSLAAQIHAAETVTAAAAQEAPSEEAQEERANLEKTRVAQSGGSNIRNRLRESARRLREAYQRQKEKAAKIIPLKQSRQEKPKEKTKGTRTADREAMLAMQAENHYLLDSYDHNGNYSTLGKSD